MNVEQMESRENPAPWIPGWDGGEQVALIQVDDDPLSEKAVVALSGGSCRVMVFDDTEAVLLNEIVFDPNFRGGGKIKAVPQGVGFGLRDSLIVVPGDGGGPHVMRFMFSDGGKTIQSVSFFAPYSQTFRGGLQASIGDVDGDGIQEVMFLPVSGGTPHLVAVDMTTYETELSVYVGDQDAKFSPTGGLITTPKGRTGVVIQYGEANEFLRVQTRIWSMDGEDITSDLASGPIVQTPE